MKKITFFYLETCPYCAQARRAMKELADEDVKYRNMDIEWVEETKQPDKADAYDYYHVPTMFIGKDKLYEAQPGESYEQCRAHVKAVFDEALA